TAAASARSAGWSVRRRTSWSPLLAGLVPLGDVLGEPLAPFQGLVDRHLTGDRRAHVLRHLGAQVGELGDVDELDADRRPRLDAGVARVGAGDGGLGGRREG